jgi:purine nucleoside permease
MRLIALLLSLGLCAFAAPPIPIKVVIVTMFEIGNDEGDRPGELQYWVEREKLTQTIPFPQGNRPLRSDGKGVLLLNTGVGTAKAAASIMALGMDPRFDLKNTWWLIAGIAGGDPADTTLGAAVWADYVVDGDLAHEIDAREIPEGWSTGFVPLRGVTPYQKPRAANEGQVYRLDPKLVDQAWEWTRGIELMDNDAMKTSRMRYEGYPNAQAPPHVQRGDTLQSSTFWHGKKLNEWANDWVRYYSDGAGNYVTTAMEDTGSIQSLVQLERAGRVNAKRVLVLRTVSNFDMPPPGMTAAESLASNKSQGYAGMLPSLDAAWRVGSVVIRKLRTMP